MWCFFVLIGIPRWPQKKKSQKFTFPKITLSAVFKCSSWSFPHFMTYHRVCNQINTTGAISRAGTAYPSVAPEFIPVFSGIRVTRSLVLCVCYVDRCLSFWSLYCLFFFDLQILITTFVYSNSCLILIYYRFST